MSNLLRIAHFIPFLLIAATGYCQTLEDLAKTQQEKVAAALSRLNRQRETIQNEQLPLVKTLNELDAAAESLRRKVEQKRQARDSRSLSLETLKNRLNDQSKDYDYITRVLFGEFSATYQASLSAGEQATFNPPIQALNLALDAPDTTDGERLQASIALIEQSLNRIEGLLGGKRYPGEALDVEGKLIAGQFVQAGPLLYFANEANNNTGIVQETQQLRAKVYPLSSAQANAIRAVATTGKGDLPIDTSLGKAFALAQNRDTLMEHLRKGGIWVYPILLFAFSATLAAVLKVMQIFTIRHPEPLVVHDIVKLIREGQTEAAQTLACQQPEPAATMLTQAVAHADESIDLVEEVMYETLLTTQPKLERFLNIIALTAAIAPLLGLLGTVTGIIKTFKLMNLFGAGDPKPLISGISEALITTELGLVLAIPALILHALLSRKVAGAMAHLEKLSVAFVNGLSRKGVPS